MYHAVINENNKVVNIVLWDGKALWHPGPGLTTVPCFNREGSLGDTYDETTQKFVKAQ